MPELELSAYAAEKRLRAATVTRLSALGEGPCAAVVGLASSLGMNDNHLRDTLDLLDDIAARRHCDVGQVLANEEIVAIRRREVGRSERIRALKACLRRLRYPQLSAALDRIEGLRNDLALPAAVRLEVPENLEGSELVVTVRASSAQQLRSRVAALAQACERGEIDSIFAIWQEAEG